MLKVRQSTHAALLALIERGLLDKDSAEFVVAPTLYRMSLQLDRSEFFTLAIDVSVELSYLLENQTELNS